MKFSAARAGVLVVFVALLAHCGGEENDSLPPEFACVVSSDCDNDRLCEAGQCVECIEGVAGCECRPDATCDAGLACSDRLCSPILLAEDVQCVTPCSGDLLGSDGSVRTCGPDRLMAGCLRDQQCDSGRCVDADWGPQNGQQDQCLRETDCPDYQACIEGQCRSICDNDSHCSSDAICFRHVCRASCRIDSSDCPANTFCQSEDGNAGACVPLLESQPIADLVPPPVTGSFELSARSFVFDTLVTQAAVTITNTTTSPRTFTIRKVSHYEPRDTGRIRVVDNPLHWVTLGVSGGQPVLVQEVEITIPGVDDVGGNSAQVLLASARNEFLRTWTGSIEVSTPGLGAQSIDLNYSESASGIWEGSMFFFANFPDERLDDWLDGEVNSQLVENALFQKWQLMRTDGLDGVREFQAVLEATRTEYWKTPAMRELCKQGQACYPYNNTFGFNTYTTNLQDSPIPTGVSEMPIVLHLEENENDETLLEGRIDSATTLQYPGDPKATLKFATSLSGCSSRGRHCLVDVEDFSATIEIGGRFNPEGGCPAGYEPVDVPFLVPGYEAGTVEIEGRRYRRECRQVDRPLVGEDSAPINATYSATNPIPDGRLRQRHLTFIDGFMVDNASLFILFKETFVSFLGDETDGAENELSAYGYMVLRPGEDRYLTQEQLNTLYDYNLPGEPEFSAPDIPSTTCSTDLIRDVFGSLTDYNKVLTQPGKADELVNALVDGEAAVATVTPVQDYGGPGYSGHYYCVETGIIDQGPVAGDPIACPAASDVTYFVLAGVSVEQIRSLPCNQQALVNGEIPFDPDTGFLTQRGTCGQTLERWVEAGTHSIVLDPLRRCTDANQLFCDADRTNLLADAYLALPPPNARPVFNPLASQVEAAFRYRTRFVNREGTGLGFAPIECAPGVDRQPYCYDPLEIELAGERIDCAVDLLVNHPGTLSATSRDTLRDTLGRTFSCDFTDTQSGRCLRFGYEHLLAELSVTLGDESYTNAFASRFDLAGSNQALFEGDLFEPDGIRLAGGAGFEFYSLYLAVQHYQYALDRFFKLTPAIWKSLRDENIDALANLETATTYFSRLIRAASQKARAQSEIAMRYAAFNRPDLARLVAERSYAGTYLESVVFSQILKAVLEDESLTAQPQLIAQMEDAQRNFRSALLDLADVNGSITEESTAFGFPAEYIPFPAVDPVGPNAFEVTYASALTKLNTARDKELVALGSSRNFDVDQAAFESELVSIRNNYEDRLAAVCGTFVGDNGQVYPAISKYSGTSSEFELVLDPCGEAGVGELHQARGEFDLSGIALKLAIERSEDVLAQIEIEQERVFKQCEAMRNEAAYVFNEGNEVIELEQKIADARRTIAVADAAYQTASAVAEALDCVVGLATSCPGSIAASSIKIAAAGTRAVTVASAQFRIEDKQNEIRKNQNAVSKWRTEQGCVYAETDSAATIRSLALQLDDAELEVLRAQYGTALALDHVEALRNEATRLQAAQEEAEQLSINVQVAKNDPNVRIYRNDAILSADRTFDDAIREVYRATLVYEYYTSQSYARKGDLFLARMVTAGDVNLESYMADLEEAFFSFEEQFGQPELRVALISVRDDLMGVGLYGADGDPLSTAERVTEFRNRLADPARLDGRGYWTLPFSVNFDRLSPLTNNHKIEYIEVEVIGSRVGDAVGRVYVRQAGTGIIRGLDGEFDYSIFPERLSVTNVFFNGQKTLNLEVYSNQSLRDRPLVNTRWELIVNSKDEFDNRDIELSSLTDIRIYIYYNDFTSF